MENILATVAVAFNWPALDLCDIHIFKSTNDAMPEYYILISKIGGCR